LRGRGGWWMKIRQGNIISFEQERQKMFLERSSRDFATCAFLLFFTKPLESLTIVFFLTLKLSWESLFIRIN
jgi:hypothetical protein